jgi:two-component system cell cycle sensor histidine kinase/response regulator CckA
MNTTSSLPPEATFWDSQFRTDLMAIEARIVRQRDALLELTAEPLDDCDQLTPALERIVEVVASALDVRRVSVWQYDQARTSIVCLTLFDADTGRHTNGDVLLARDFPNYFAAMVDHDIVAVEDAVNDAKTAEFGECYLRPYGIVSMMDAPIRLKGAVIGVLCHEHCGQQRQWTPDERGFAVAVSNLVSLALERCERFRAEAASRLQVAALEAAADAIVITDHTGEIVWVNPTFTVLTGYPAREALGRQPRELLKSGRHAAPFYAEMWSTLKQGRVWRGEIFNRRKNGEIYLEDQTITPVTSGGRITHFVAIKRDLTERRTLEGQFHQAQKMEIVGRLAGGVAHDFNNLLTVINGTAELALMDLPVGHPLRKDLEDIHECGLRAAGLTRQLLTFSRKEIVNRAPLVMADVLLGFRRMLQRLIGEDISLEVRADDSAGAVLADQGQMEQVVLNLAVNARDAMPRGGRLSIEASAVDLDEDFARTHVNVRSGPHVRLVVRDTGVGMSSEVLSRIFEPFFTTKEPGKGTGLGLATVYAIVAQSGGTIWVSSTVGEGSAFTIYLPRIAASASGQTPAPGRPSAGRGTILIVEDDEAVRQMTATILEHSGYVIVSAGHAMDGLQALALHPAPVDLIVTDVVLPGMGGHELASHASAIVPDIPVLFTSGHAADLVLAHGVREGLTHFLAKPYTPHLLTAKVGEMLEQRESR